MRPPEVARQLFAPIASSYERWASVLSMGQDARWRKLMVASLSIRPGSLALDVAAGTGSITRLLQRDGAHVVALDQSAEMLAEQSVEGAWRVAATAEHLPFSDSQFDSVTFGYLLRYVDDLPGCLAELARVVRPGGILGMVEFGRPRGVWGAAWIFYTRVLLPVAGRLIGSGWVEVGRFLGGSIDRFAGEWPLGRLEDAWRAAGLVEVEVRRPSLGGGLVVWARKP